MDIKHQNNWSKLYSDIPKPVKTAFYACLIIGFAVHLYAFTNIIPNSDGLSRIYDTQQMTISGRWFLHYASMLHGYIQAPALIGMLSLIFLSLSAAMTTDLLRLRGTYSAVACGSFMVVFPAMAYTYLYMFTASAYAFGIFLAVLSIWMFRKYRWAFVPSALILACSVGTYQAYFAVAVSLGLICVLFDLLNPQQPLGDTVKNGFRLLGMLLLSAVLYFSILKLILYVKDLTLLDYRGIDSVGSQSSVQSFLHSILSVYKQLFLYFLMPYASPYNTTLLTAAHWSLMVAAMFSLVQICIASKSYQEPMRLFWLLLGMLLLPLALNFTQLLSDSSPNMRYPFVFVYVLAITLLDHLPPTAKSISGITKTIGCACCALVVLLSAQIDNLAYTASATAHRATEVFATNLVSRIEQTSGYRSDMDVVIIGTFPRTVYHSSVDAFSLVEHYSCMSDTVMQLNKHVYYYLNDWLNIPWEEPEESIMKAVSDSELFQSMPLYPNDGSILIQNNQVIVKLAPHYIPKQPYEIEYERRH